MQIDEFIQKFAKQFIEPDNLNIHLNTVFRQLETWDSLTGMAILAMIQDEYSVIITVDEFLKISTPMELFKLVKSKKIE